MVWKLLTPVQVCLPVCFLGCWVVYWVYEEEEAWGFWLLSWQVWVAWVSVCFCLLAIGCRVFHTKLIKGETSSGVSVLCNRSSVSGWCSVSYGFWICSVKEGERLWLDNSQKLGKIPRRWISSYSYREFYWWWQPLFAGAYDLFTPCVLKRNE